MSLGADKKFSIILSPFWPLAENWLTGSDKSEGCKWHLRMFSWPSGGHCPLHVREPLLFQPLCKAPSSAWAVSLRYQSRDDQQTVIIICKKKKNPKTQEAEIYRRWLLLHGLVYTLPCRCHLLGNSAPLTWNSALPPKCICSEALTAFYGENHVIEVLQRGAHCRDRITEASGTTSCDESDARPLASEPCHPC